MTTSCDRNVGAVPKKGGIGWNVGLVSHPAKAVTVGYQDGWQSRAPVGLDIQGDRDLGGGGRKAITVGDRPAETAVMRGRGDVPDVIADAPALLNRAGQLEPGVELAVHGERPRTRPCGPRRARDVFLVEELHLEPA